MTPLSNRKGYRGYICARMSMGRSTPQHIQQLVMRDYCQKRGMTFLLSATEYCMPGCTLMLDAVLDELDQLEGIVMYSLMLFPQDAAKRHRMYTRLIGKGCSLHTAVEGVVIRDWDDVRRIEDIWLVHETMKGQDDAIYRYFEAWDQADAGTQLPRSVPEENAA